MTFNATELVKFPIHLYHSAAILESVGNKGFVFALFLPVQPHTEWEARRAKSFVCTLSDMGVLLLEDCEELSTNTYK